MRIFLILCAAFALTACGAMGGKGAYESGLDANVQQYKLFSDTQLAQQQSIQACYQFNPNKSECSINMASTNAVQTLAGQPKPLRVAKSIGEIMETIADKGFEAAKIIYGIDAVQKAISANAAAMGEMSAANSAAQASTAQAGIEAAAKDPLVVHTPASTIVQVPLGSSILTPAQ